MRHKRQRLAADKVLIWATGAAGLLNAVSGIVQFAFGHWTGFVGLGCAAVCLGLMVLERRIYRRRTEPPKTSRVKCISVRCDFTGTPAEIDAHLAESIGAGDGDHAHLTLDPPGSVQG